MLSGGRGGGGTARTAGRGEGGGEFVETLPGWAVGGVGSRGLSHGDGDVVGCGVARYYSYEKIITAP